MAKYWLEKKLLFIEGTQKKEWLLSIFRVLEGKIVNRTNSDVEALVNVVVNLLRATRWGIENGTLTSVPLSLVLDGMILTAVHEADDATRSEAEAVKAEADSDDEETS